MNAAFDARQAEVRAAISSRDALIEMLPPEERIIQREFAAGEDALIEAQMTMAEQQYIANLISLAASTMVNPAQRREVANRVMSLMGLS